MFRALTFMMWVAIFCSFGNTKGDEIVTIHSPQERLASISVLLRSAIARDSISNLHNQHVSLLQVLNRSAWRHSIRDAVHLLVGSENAEDRIAGWKLAREWGYKMDWGLADIDRLVDDPSDDVRIAAIRATSTTDAGWMSNAIERFIRSPKASTACKQVCIRHLDKVVESPLRLRLWLEAAVDESLQAECVFTFSAVNSSELATRVVVGFLDKRTTTPVAYSEDLALPIELRILACEALRMAHQHKEFVANELQKRCNIAPEKEHLQFFLAAILASHALIPESSDPENLLMKWYDALQDDRSRFLERLEGAVANFSKFEALVISKMHDAPPEQRCHVCQWLSDRISRESIFALAKMLRDPHPGVRVAAAVALATADPLVDLSDLREELVATADSAPEEFCVAFQSAVDAVIALAMAGQSDSDAVGWLRRQRTPGLQSICEEAAQSIAEESSRSGTRNVPWKEWYLMFRE